MNDPTHKQIIMRVYDSIKNALRVTVDQSDSDPIPVEESSLVNKILNAEDRVKQFTFLDGGTKNERISEILISAASVGVQVVKKDYTYIQVGNNYVLESETTSIV